jgi:putative drug exporter of the RND superfamily
MAAGAGETEHGRMNTSRLTSTVTRHPWLVIALWLVAAFALSTAGTLKAADVTTDDQATFLPSKYESAKALQFGRDAFGEVKGASTTTVLIKRGDGGKLTAADARTIASVTSGLSAWKPDWRKIERPGGVADPNAKERATRVVSAAAGGVDPHGLALVGLKFKGNSSDPWVQAAFKQLRADTRDRFAAHGMTSGFTGGVAMITDITDASRGLQRTGQLLLFGAALLLTAVFFRGVLAAVVPLLTVLVVGGAASGVVTLGAAALGLTLDTSTPQLITVVLVGVGIDYFLFLLFRFRERLRAGDGRKDAARNASIRISPVIASAAFAVSIAFATLALAQFGQLRALGPAIAVAVAVMLLAGVTLMPAVLAVTGRGMFWPSKSWQRAQREGFAHRLGAFVADHPGRVVAASVAVLATLAVGALGVRLNYDTGGPAKGTESARVSDEITRALPPGAADPQTIYVKSDHALGQDELAPLLKRVGQVRGVAQVGEPRLNADRHAAQLPVVLRYATGTDEAIGVAEPLRDAAHAAAPRGTQAMVAGSSAIVADIGDSMQHDLRLIFPLAAGLILLVLIVLLRSIKAPLYLLAAVALEFVATLGATVWVFQGAAGEPGLMFTIPLVLFLFVTALGTDYNMLASARLREELERGRSVRDAVAAAVRHTAPAIGAAGAVLAASFGTLVVETDQSSKQTGFATAFGIMLAAFVVSTLLVPALTALVNRRREPATRPDPTRPSAASSRGRWRETAASRARP